MHRLNPVGGARWALFAMSVGVFCIQLDAFALNLALPRIGQDLHAGEGDLPWAVSAYLLATGTLMLGAGRLGDLFGRRRLLVVGLAVFGASSLACALATSLASLVVARVVQGAGAALVMPVGLALLTNIYPADLRGRATGWALGVGGIATACGPFVGGMLTDAVSWRAVFWLNVPLAVLGAVCASRAPESRDTSGPSTVDRAGLLTGTAALAALAVLVDRGQRWGWLTDRTAALLVLVVLLLIWFVRCERRAAAPLVRLRLFRNGPYIALTLAGAVVNTATVMFLFVVPLSLQGPWHLSVATAGIAFLAPAVAMAVAGPLAGRVAPRGAVAVMAACLGIGAVMLGELVWAPRLAVYLIVATVGAAVLGMGNALTLVATQGVIRPERAGEASGVTKTVITVAAGLGVGLTGSVADPQDGAGVESAIQTALLATAVGCLAACLALLLWLRRRRVPGGPVQEHVVSGPDSSYGPAGSAVPRRRTHG